MKWECRICDGTSRFVGSRFSDCMIHLEECHPNEMGRWEVIEL